MTVKYLSFLVVSLLIVCSCSKVDLNSQATNVGNDRGILNGTAVKSNKEALKYGPILRILVGSSSCSASHLGNGIILTAFHCVKPILDQIKKADKDAKGNISILSPTLPKWIAEVSEDDFEVLYPEAEFYEEMAGGSANGTPIKNPQPDLTIVKLKGSAKDTLSKVGKILIATEVLTETSERISIAGYGLAPVFPTVVSGALHYGNAKIKEVKDMFYQLKYDEDSESSAALPGDSGGPLFSKTSKGEFQIHGVASTLGVTAFNKETKDISKAQNNYVRLDREPVQKWLKSVLENN